MPALLKTYRSKKWLAAVGSIEQCVLCGRWGTQVAHRNQGKGMGLKADDCATAAICVCCHDSIDNGNKLSRDERRQLIDRAIVLTTSRFLLNSATHKTPGWHWPPRRVAHTLGNIVD